MVKNLKPVSVAGIEFDALIDETKTLSATIPTYPVEDGFPVSDTIVLNPLTVSMTLYVSNTPVTWLYRHGSSTSRVREICDQIETLWMEKTPVKIITTDAIYTDMGITDISIKKSKDIGYAREISLTAQKIKMTSRKTVDIPSYLLKSGTTQASAGTASTSKTSSSVNRTTSKNTSSQSVSGIVSGSSNSTSSGMKNPDSSASKSSSSNNSSKKSASILYGVASGLGFI